MNVVIRVGDGRGFIVKDAGKARAGLGNKRIVITAAHCLPFFPPGPASFVEERTYQSLLGLLGQEPTVWAECLFVDPIADIAVLGEPDHQELSKQCTAYNALVTPIRPLPIADAPKARLSCYRLTASGSASKAARFGSRTPPEALSAECRARRS